MSKTILIKTDGYSIEHFFYSSYANAKTVMDSQYAALIPEEWFEDCKDTSYCSDYNAILYRNGEDVYVWKIVVMDEIDSITVTSGDPTVSGVSIQRTINDTECVIELTESEIEKAFRYQDERYMMEDAKNHLLAYVDYDEEDEELKAEFKERFGVDFDALINDDNVLSQLAQDFSEEQDCNIAENTTWDYVVEEYLERVKSYVVSATFVSVWDGGTEINSPCMVNLETKEIFNITKVDTKCDVDILEGEYVKIGEDLYGACSKEDADTNPGYWYWYR